MAIQRRLAALYLASPNLILLRSFLAAELAYLKLVPLSVELSS